MKFKEVWPQSKESAATSDAIEHASQLGLTTNEKAQTTKTRYAPD